MADAENKIADLMAKLGLTTQQLEGIRLGPGVIGRNSSIAWIFLFVMLTGAIVAGYLRDGMLLGIALGGAIVGTLFITALNVYFGNKNPAAGLMEGAQFLQYQQMQMASKTVPVIELGPPAIPAPPQLESGESNSTPSPDEGRNG